MKVIYPGSFDPITYGHLDVIHRSAGLFDEVVVGVLVNTNKQSLFRLEERIEMIRELLYDCDNVVVEGFSGLLVDFVRLHEADGVVRGIREFSDFEIERQMAQINRSLYPKMETLFLAADGAHVHISASHAREVASWGGDVSTLVPPSVAKRLMEKYNTNGGK